MRKIEQVRRLKREFGNRYNAIGIAIGQVMAQCEAGAFESVKWMTMTEIEAVQPLSDELLTLLEGKR